MGGYGVAVGALAMACILLYASIECCVLGGKPAEYSGDSAVARIVQVLGAGVGVGAVGALCLTWLGADVVYRSCYARAVGRLSVWKNWVSDCSRRETG